MYTVSYINAVRHIVIKLFVIMKNIFCVFLALAFCNYTKLQTKRRRLLKKFTFPHAQSANWDKLDRICQMETQQLIRSLNDKINGSSESGPNMSTSGVVDIKELIMKACGNIFNAYFCSLPRTDYSDQTFSEYIHNFDKIFWEVNNGRACDFLPWLMPLMVVPLKMMEKHTSNVRNFVENQIIEPKRQNKVERRTSLDGTNNHGDFLDSLMKYIDEDRDEEEMYKEEYKKSELRGSDVKIDRQTALYALEDILGGHCAVGNITLRIINDLAENSKTIEEGNHTAQEKIQYELDANIGKSNTVSLDSKKDLHWMTAAIYETIRLTCSPIVPHQASKESTINGKLTIKFGDLRFSA